jgi:ComF family protein
VAYAYPWSDCISHYKFGAQPGWAGTFATLLRSTPWVEPALDAASWVLPMPLSAQRLRERGFNQAHEIARRLAPRKTRTDLLQRWRDTPPQRQLNRAERAQNVLGAYGVNPLQAHLLQGATVVLVDDVMTSGASLHAAALALRAAGASPVSAVVVARTDAPDQTGQ